MDKFWQLLKESVILQATITLLISATICALILTNRQVPDILIETFLLIVGFYFGSKSTMARG